MARIELESAKTEKDVQSEVVAAVKSLGYLVQETSIKIRGKRKRWNMIVGIDAGISDLLIGRTGWGPVRLCLEMKGPKTALSDEQKRLLDLGLIEVARSLEEAIAAIQRFQERYGLPGPTVRIRGGGL